MKSNYTNIPIDIRAELPASDGLLFTQFSISRQMTRNRIWVPPMCQYMGENGLPTNWHYQHYANLSIAAGCVIVEATAISREGMVTPEDLLLDENSPLSAYAELANKIAANGALPGIQLCHGGRKSSRSSPWNGNAPLTIGEGGWRISSPSAIAYGAGYQLPEEMTPEAIQATIEQFAASAKLAVAAGFRLIEIHGGHGRLVHSFLSKIANKRTDSYGVHGTTNRYLSELSAAVRAAIGEEPVLGFRLSCVDYLEGGLTLDDTLLHAGVLQLSGVDFIDCTSGGIATPIKKQTFPGYQVPYSAAIKAATGIHTTAVGEITTLKLADEVVTQGQASVAMMGRKLLTDPYYLLRSAAALGRWDLVPKPYQRALKRSKTAQLELVPEL